MSLSSMGLSSGLVDLNGDGRYLTLGWLSISWGNAVVIALMLLTFAVALFLPFPAPQPSTDSSARPAENDLPGDKS